jgi:hypothetical protein
LISALHIFFCFDAYDDIAAYYAIAVRAFAEQDWYNAFSIRLPILSVTLGGLFSSCGLGPFRSLVVVSCLFYIASVPVLYYVLKYFLKREDYAAWGCVLYVLAPKIIRFSCTGLLNPAKNFFIITAIALILASSKRLRWMYSLLLGIVLAGLALARAETIIFLPLLVLWYAYFIYMDKESELKKRLVRIFFHCLVITVVFFICVSPRLYQSYKTAGVPTLDLRQAYYVCKMLPFKEFECEEKLYIMAERKTVIPSPKIRHGWTLTWQSMECFTRGAYTPYLLFALLGIFLWWRKKENRAEGFILFSIIALNTAVLITISNSVRYYTINLIMFLPFTFIGFKFVWDLLISYKKIFKPVLITALCVVAVYQIINGAKKAISHKYDYEYGTGAWIDANKDKFGCSRPRIIVASSQPQYALWADAVWMNISDNKIQFAEQLEEMKNADFVVLEDDQHDAIDILKKQKSFKLLEQLYPETFIFVRSKGERK